MNDCQHRARRAFSLIELLVAVSVVGVLGTITVVAMGNATQSAHKTSEIAGARQLISGYLLYPQEHGGRLLPAVPDSRELAMTTVKDQQGAPVLNRAAAARYPFRLLPYVDALESFYAGKTEQHYEDILAGGGDASYALSLHPAFGLNNEYTGGNYDDRRLHPETGYYPRLAITRVAQAENPSQHIVFVSAFYGEDANTSAPYVGFHRVEAPKGLRSSWSRYNEELPAQMGYVHLRHEGQALVAHLDGSIAFLGEDELKDMRRWSNQARQQGDPNFSPGRGR